MVQKNEQKPKKNKNFIGKLIAEQLNDENFKKHLSSLGEALQSLAVDATDPATQNPDTVVGPTLPSNPQDRLAALHIKPAFEMTARKILADKDLKHFRERLSEIVEGSPEVSLAIALAGIMTAYLANVSVKGDQGVKLGKSGFKIGGAIDLGKAQELEFKKAAVYVEFAKKLVKLKLEGGVKKEKEEGEEKERLVGVGKGELKIGNKKATVTGALEVKGRGSEFTFHPALTGVFNLGGDRTLRVGTKVEVSTATGLKTVNGSIEFRANRLFLRMDADLNKLPRRLEIAPGLETRVQGTIGFVF